MTQKKYALDSSDIRPIAEGYGACYATDRITVEGHPVRLMYREEPDNAQDSGWRFMSGVDETAAYLDNPDNLGIYDVNTIANYDQTIVPHLNAPVGSYFEKPDGADEFVEVDAGF